MDTILTVKKDDLNRLNPQEAVEFISQLLWAEATSIGLGINKINIPSEIYVPDSGIDAVVTDAQVVGGQGIIKPGLTCYQIKTGDFNISQKNYIKEILFQKDTTMLKPKVKSCLDKNGTLVIVLFGWDKPERRDDGLKNKFQEALIKIDDKYRTANIEIWRQNQIIGSYYFDNVTLEF